MRQEERISPPQRKSAVAPWNKRTARSSPCRSSPSLSRAPSDTAPTTGPCVPEQYRVGGTKTQYISKWEISTDISQSLQTRLRFFYAFVNLQFLTSVCFLTKCLINAQWTKLFSHMLQILEKHWKEFNCAYNNCCLSKSSVSWQSGKGGHHGQKVHGRQLGTKLYDLMKTELLEYQTKTLHVKVMGLLRGCRAKLYCKATHDPDQPTSVQRACISLPIFSTRLQAQWNQ